MPPESCKLMPLPFMSVKIFGKPFIPFMKCFNVDGAGLQYNDKERGYTVSDPRTIIWEDSPTCGVALSTDDEGKATSWLPGVRIHFVDGEASTGMNNLPEVKEQYAMKHPYHAMTFITISKMKRRMMREAMVHRLCSMRLSPWQAMWSAGALRKLRNFGGPNIMMPFFMWMPMDEFDFTTFTIANTDKGDCD